MPLFFFHLRTPDGLELNEDGLAFADLDAAYLEACEAIPDIAAEIIEKGQDPFLCAFIVAGEHGEMLMDVPFAERIRSRRPIARHQQEVRARRLSQEIAEAISNARQTVKKTREILARAQAS